jgi:hypothetical protein
MESADTVAGTAKGANNPSNARTNQVRRVRGMRVRRTAGQITMLAF